MMRLKKLTAIIMILTLCVSMCACGRGKAATTVGVGGNTYDLSGSFEDMVKAFSDKGLILYDNIARKVISPDGSSVLDGEGFEMGNTVMTRKNTYNPYDVDYSECCGYYEYGFYEKLCGEATGIGGIKNTASVETLTEAGFIDTGRAFVKLFADGKEVKINKYRDMARDYLVARADNVSEYSFLADRGCVKDEEDFHKYATGYGIVREINLENWGTLMSYNDSQGYKSYAKNPKEYERQSPAMLDCFAVAFAARELNRKYQNGKIKSLVAVMFTNVREEENLMFVNVACDGSEVGEWYDMILGK